jgi:RNA polymerase sigma-70 factor (ECF subfamily)
MHQQWTEEKIIAGCKNNKRKARKALYDRYHRYLLGIAMQYAKDKQEAESILLEGMMKIYDNIHTFKGLASFIAWMKRIIINTAIDKIRKEQKFSFLVSIDDVVDNSEIYVEMDEELSLQKILKSIQSLPPQYRLVFNLFAIEGYSHQEIADKLNISIGTSKSNLHKSRKRLKELLKEYR